MDGNSTHITPYVHEETESKDIAPGLSDKYQEIYIMFDQTWMD